MRFFLFFLASVVAPSAFAAVSVVPGGGGSGGSVTGTYHFVTHQFSVVGSNVNIKDGFFATNANAMGAWNFSNSVRIYGAMTNLGTVRMESGLTMIENTASRVAIFDGNKQLTNSVVTVTELGFLTGVTSALQTQLANKIAMMNGQGTNTTLRGDVRVWVPDGGVVDSFIVGGAQNGSTLGELMVAGTNVALTAGPSIWLRRGNGPANAANTTNGSVLGSYNFSGISTGDPELPFTAAARMQAWAVGTQSALGAGAYITLEAGSAGVTGAPKEILRISDAGLNVTNHLVVQSNLTVLGSLATATWTNSLPTTNALATQLLASDGTQWYWTTAPTVTMNQNQFDLVGSEWSIQKSANLTNIDVYDTTGSSIAGVRIHTDFAGANAPALQITAGVATLLEFGTNMVLLSRFGLAVQDAGFNTYYVQGPSVGGGVSHTNFLSPTNALNGQLLASTAAGQWYWTPPPVSGSGSGETNFLGNAGLTNSTRFSWLGPKVGVSNLVKTFTVSGATVADEGTNLAFTISGGGGADIDESFGKGTNTYITNGFFASPTLHGLYATLGAVFNGPLTNLGDSFLEGSIKFGAGSSAMTWNEPLGILVLENLSEIQRFPGASGSGGALIDDIIGNGSDVLRTLTLQSAAGSQTNRLYAIGDLYLDVGFDKNRGVWNISPGAATVTSPIIIDGLMELNWRTNALTYASTVNVPMDTNAMQIIVATGALALNTTNRTALTGFTRKEVRVVASGGDQVVTLNSAWNIYGTNVFTVPSGKVAKIELWKHGTTEAGIEAAYLIEDQVAGSGGGASVTNGWMDPTQFASVGNTNTIISGVPLTNIQARTSLKNFGVLTNVGYARFETNVHVAGNYTNVGPAVFQTNVNFGGMIIPGENIRNTFAAAAVTESLNLNAGTVVPSAPAVGGIWYSTDILNRRFAVEIGDAVDHTARFLLHSDAYESVGGFTFRTNAFVNYVSPVIAEVFVLTNSFLTLICTNSCVVTLTNTQLAGVSSMRGSVDGLTARTIRIIASGADRYITNNPFWRNFGTNSWFMVPSGKTAYLNLLIHGTPGTAGINSNTDASWIIQSN